MAKSRNQYGIFIRPEYRELLENEITEYYLYNGKYFTASKMNPAPPFVEIRVCANDANKQRHDEEFLIPQEFILFVVSDPEPEKDFGFQSAIAAFEKK